MFRSLLTAAALLAASALPAAAVAQQPEEVLKDARARVASMKQSQAAVQKLRSQAPKDDQLQVDCLQESTETIGENLSHAEATIQAAAGWGIDVAEAVLKSVMKAEVAVDEQRSQAYSCAGVEDEGLLAREEGSEGQDERDEGEETKERVAKADEPASFDPFSIEASSRAGSVSLSNRAPAASPTK